MSWFVLALACSLFTSLKDLSTKNATSAQIPELSVAWVVLMVQSFVLLPWVLLTPPPSLTTNFWLGVAYGAISMPISNYLMARALRYAPMTEVSPLLALNPVITAIVAIFFEKHLPGMLGTLGIILVALGLFISASNFSDTNWRQPVLRLIRGKAFLPMFGVTLVWALSANVGKVLAVESSPLYGTFGSTAAAAITLSVIHIFRGNLKALKFLRSRHLFLAGTAGASSDLLLMTALQFAFTPYVICVKRTSMVWSSLIGRWCLKEPLPLRKVIGLCLDLIGVVLILIGS